MSIRLEQFFYLTLSIIVIHNILFYYPFILRYLFEHFYAISFFSLQLVLLILFFLFILRKKKVKQFFSLNRNFRKSPLMSLILYFLYLFSLYSATLFNLFYYSDYSIKPLATSLFNFFFALLLLFFLPENIYKKTLDIYSHLLFFLSAIGIIMTILIALEKLSPLYEIRIDVLKTGIDSGIRQFYGLGFGWMNIKLGSFTFPRLQSFASEAGNFALALLVALIWTLRKENVKIKTITMTIALLLTLSVGAFVTAVFLLSLLLLREAFLGRKKRIKSIFINSLCLSIVLTLIYILLSGTQFYQDLKTMIKWYIDTKFYTSNFDNTSLGTRIEGMRSVIIFISNHPWGVGADTHNTFQTQIANGWIRALLMVGPIGYFLYLLAFLLLLIESLKTILFSKNPDKVAISFIFVTLFIMASQRAAIDQTLWHWWLIFAFIRLHTSRSTNEGIHRSGSSSQN